jgi:hypothetical protein
LPRAPHCRFQGAGPSRAGGDAEGRLTAAEYGKFQKLSGKEVELVSILVVPEAQSEGLGVGRFIPDLFETGNIRKENIIHAISPS